MKSDFGKVPKAAYTGTCGALTSKLLSIGNLRGICNERKAEDRIVYMLYRSFLDDSKDKHQQQLVVSAGFFARRDDWSSFRMEWKSVLQRHNLRYFKSSEFNWLEGEFARFKGTDYPPPTGRHAAIQIREELKQVVDRHPRVLGIAIGVLVEDYKRALQRKEAGAILPSNIYLAAFNSIMFETVKKVVQLCGERQRVAFVHDEGPENDGMLSSYRSFKKHNPTTARSLAGFGWLSDEDHPELQLADLLSNYALQRGLEALQQDRDCLKTVIKELRNNFIMFGYWDEDYILSAIKSISKARGLPIPVDLEDQRYD